MSLLSRFVNPPTYTSDDVGALAANDNAVSASKLANALNLVFSGDVSGGVSFRGDEGSIVVDLQTGDDTHSHVIGNVDGLQGALNDLQSGIDTKLNKTSRAADSLLLDGKSSDFYANKNNGSSGQDPNFAAAPVIVTSHSNCPSASYYWHITTTFYNSISSGVNRSQIAVQYNGGTSAYCRTCYLGAWTAWVRMDNAGIAAATTAALGLTKKPTISNAASGYWRCNDSGLLINWGYSGGPNAYNVTFPVAFSSACRSVTIGPRDTSDVGIHYIRNVTNTYFTMDNKNGNTTEFAYWMAIGV